MKFGDFSRIETCKETDDNQFKYNTQVERIPIFKLTKQILGWSSQCPFFWNILLNVLG